MKLISTASICGCAALLAFAPVAAAQTSAAPESDVSAPAAVPVASVEAAPAPVSEPSVAIAQPETAPAAPSPEAAPVEALPVKKPPPPPYSLPFGLRPVAVANVVRSDTAIAFFKDPVSGKSGRTLVSTLLGSAKLTDELGVLLRLGAVSNRPPDTSTDPGTGVGLLNPVLGANYAMKFAGKFRLTPFLGVALPWGTGGGKHPAAAEALARNDGIWARSAMDNAMFAVNDLVVFPGLGFAYVADGLTIQAEATVLKLTRVRGNDKVQPDKSRWNFTGGLHIGYFFIPQFSLGAEIRHQHWLSTPKAVAANDALRSTTTWAVGPRLHFKLNDTMWFRPGVAFAMPLDDPMKAKEYKNIQIDLPIAF